MATWTVKKMWTGLSDEEVKENFPIFEQKGADNIRLPNVPEDIMSDGKPKRCRVGYILELDKTNK